MDNKTTPMQPQMAPAAHAAAMPAPTPAVNQSSSTTPPKKSGHKGLLLILGIVVLIAFVGGAAYLLLQNESTTEISEVQIQSTQQYNSPSPTIVPIEGTVEEVEAVMIDENTSNVTEIQTDINQL